ncbi:hypothetical protein D9619_012243 [Psilocybe cf. subviscida]|uniref:Cytochrome P450 n=1 Tax=Psilocybe cf. subviscida TaxID=2480587 RepID=A0A8H5EZA6_9AGAR|nr:hypothetical protein D9619_012243 [Psilocybe cf. subviscida]
MGRHCNILDCSGYNRRSTPPLLILTMSWTGVPVVYNGSQSAEPHPDGHHIYQKPESAIYNIRRILGTGVLLVDGEVHKRQRKALNPAFGPQQIRELTHIFVDKALHLRDIRIEEVKKQEQGVARIDALAWLGRATLDVIGSAGFNYDFNALEKGAEEDELSCAFAAMFQRAQRFSLIPILRALVPPLRFLPASGDSEAAVASKTMFRIGMQLLKTANKLQLETSKTRSLGKGGTSCLF